MLCRKYSLIKKIKQKTRYAAAAKSLQSCPTLCDPMDGSPPGSAVPGFLQARTLEWVAISFSNAWKWKVKVKSLSLARLFETPWTAAYQAPPSMGFSRQEYWSGLPLQSLEKTRYRGTKNNRYTENKNLNGRHKCNYISIRCEGINQLRLAEEILKTQSYAVDNRHTSPSMIPTGWK